MNLEPLNLFVNSVILGIGATVIMDIWALLLQHFLGIIPLNYALVGRWVISLLKGKIHHHTIVDTPPATAELAFGWLIHYVTGIFFATGLLCFMGQAWLSSPTITPAITFGVLTVIFPFLIMQPSMGFGIAAAKLPKPNIARMRSLLTHFIFGLGLYLTAIILGFILIK